MKKKLWALAAALLACLVVLCACKGNPLPQGMEEDKVLQPVSYTHLKRMTNTGAVSVPVFFKRRRPHGLYPQRDPSRR